MKLLNETILLRNYFLTLMLFSGVIIEAMAPRVTQTLPKWLAMAVKQPRRLSSYVPKPTFGTVSPIDQRSLLPTMRSGWLQQGHVNRVSIRPENIDTSSTVLRPFRTQQHQDAPDQALFRILAAAGAATGAYFLTEYDQKVLAEEAISLEELLQHYGITYEKESDYDGITYEKAPHYEPIRIINLKKDGKRIAGVRYKRGYIALLWVDKHFRSKGLGSILLHEAIKDLRNRYPYEKIYILPSPFDLDIDQDKDTTVPILRKYYAKFGFKEDAYSTYMNYASPELEGLNKALEAATYQQFF